MTVCVWLWQVSRLLLLAGADPDARTAFLQRAPLLCVAARHGLGELVNLLLEFGANVNLTGARAPIGVVMFAPRCCLRHHRRRLGQSFRGDSSLFVGPFMHVVRLKLCIHVEVIYYV